MPNSEGGYKQFQIGKLFDKVTTKSLKYKVNELPKVPTGEFTLPALTAGVINQGLSCYVPREGATILKNVISVSANGANTGAMFFQPNEFTVLQDSYAITFKERELTKREALYFIAALEKVIRKYFDWSNKAGWNKIKDLYISVPIDKLGNIDFAFIEERVRELEEERVRELEAYLKAAGFADCTLTSDERESLNNQTGGVIRSKSIKIKDLFNIHPTASYGQTNATLFATKGNTPVIVNSSRDNGVGGWVALSPTEKGNMITYSDTTTSEAIFYQPTDFIGYSHVQGLYPHESENWNENTYLYFLSLFKKTASGRFDYATKFTRYIAMDMEVAMPVNDSNEIDYAFMETYISAIKKQTIARLIEFIKCEKEAYRIAINN